MWAKDRGHTEIARLLRKNVRDASTPVQRVSYIHPFNLLLCSYLILSYLFFNSFYSSVTAAVCRSQITPHNITEHNIT